MYCGPSPSLRKSGHMLYDTSAIARTDCLRSYLNTATLLQSTPSENTVESCGAPASKSVKGSNGSRIVFSWTWNENRKNEMELLRSAYRSTGCMTVGMPFAAPREEPEPCSLSHAFTGAMAAPRKPTTVKSADSFTRTSRGNHIRHLNKMFEAHQKFATLSSKSPRQRGKMRVIVS
jgi:hypothetical protein